MIEKLVGSKTRLKLLKLFLANIDNRYYLRELERRLDESLSPLRRQLVKLVDMGILITEEEANLKYYRLNKNFAGIEDLKRLVLRTLDVQSDVQDLALKEAKLPAAEPQSKPKRFKYDIALLTVVSLFVLVASTFVLYTSTRNIREVASLVSKSGTDSSLKARGPQTPDAQDAQVPRPSDIKPGEMISRHWKILSGNIPVLLSIETEGEKRSKEL